MVASNPFRHCWFRSLVVMFSIYGAWLSGLVNLADTGSDRLLAQMPLQPDTTPVYPPDAPPSRRSPLPNQRQQLEEQTVGTDYRVSALQPDSQGALWVGSWQGLAKINPSTGRILNRVSLPNQTVGAITQDKSGRIWVGTYEGLARIDPKTGTITAQNFALPSNRVLDLLVDQRGYLWVGTDAGLALISPDKGLLMTTVKNLPGVSANALTLDALGNLWVGTLDGVVQINTANALIKRRVTNLPGTTVQALASSPWGTLWIGTPTELLEADLGIKREIRTIQEPVAQTVKRPNLKGAQRAQTLAKSTQKPMKIRQEVVYLASEDPNRFKLRTVTQLRGRNVTVLHFDKVNSIWVGTTTGLLRVNPFNGATGGEIPYLPSNRILSISPDTGGKLWVGTSEGLAWVNTTTFRGYPHQTFQSVER
ncbi:beta-propeller domain-containing protein [Leptolyngbyaceae cyanobacterium JSC-12]|nr:beta-propeller domain-containing protein [Leptolyngbyaceae cyanobacterium JSC-12]